jgi:hypothetical protein
LRLFLVFVIIIVVIVVLVIVISSSIRPSGGVGVFSLRNILRKRRRGDFSSSKI